MKETLSNELRPFPFSCRKLQDGPGRWRLLERLYFREILLLGSTWAEVVCARKQLGDREVSAEAPMLAGSNHGFKRPSNLRMWKLYMYMNPATPLPAFERI